MDSNRLQAVCALEDSCAFLSAVFTQLPTEEMIAAVLDFRVEGSPVPADGSLADDGTAELAAWIAEARERPVADVLLDVARDRAILLRGLYEGDIVPPYESMWGAGGAENLAAVNRFYGDAGFAFTGEVHDAPDQLGVELAFVTALLEHEQEALQADDVCSADKYAELRSRFVADHVGAWSGAYTAAMHSRAQTGFYRAIARMVDRVVAEAALRQ